MDRQTIQSILANLYQLDPALASREPELVKLIEYLAAARPEAHLDERFAAKLKAQLLDRFSPPAVRPGRTPWFTNLLSMKNYRIALAVAALLLIVAVPLAIKQRLTGNNPSSPSQVAEAPNNTTQSSGITAPAGSEINTRVINSQFSDGAAPARTLALGMKKFTSEQEFQKYLSDAQRAGAPTGLSAPTPVQVPASVHGAAVAPSDVVSTDRFSTTNVQVADIDEPDIVKTDGQDIFLSGQNNFITPMRYGAPSGVPNATAPSSIGTVGPGVMARPGVMPVYQNSGAVKIITVAPAENLGVQSKIDRSGDLLVSGDNLIIFGYNGIRGYNVADKANPRPEWAVDYDNRASLVTARLYRGMIYIVTRENSFGLPCVFQPLKVNGVAMPIRCTDVYYPTLRVRTDVMYHIFSVDPATGAIKNTVSALGSSGQSTVYMSGEAIYLTYFYPGDQVKFNYNFLKANADLAPAEILLRLEKLLSYDLSDQAKQVEYDRIISQWQMSLSGDNRLKLENDLANRMDSYYPVHRRDLEQTSIVKITADDLKIVATGSVPGSLLNQYSLDEYRGNLRLATTIGQGWWGIGTIGGQRETTNDVYILDNQLKTVGNVTDLGTSERIYAVRFIADRGYMVTFRQADPLFVLDLADASHPRLAGELKIPGYSSYLHQLENHLILGIGSDGRRVKVSLYDVGNVNAPAQLVTYSLDEYWSEALNNPHAFLADTDHKLFFIPGGNGGYIFSYANNQITLVKAISGYTISRALYIGNTLYVISQNKIVAFDEQTGQTIKELDLQ